MFVSCESKLRSRESSLSSALKDFGITIITNTCAGHNDDFSWSVAQAILVSGVRVIESRPLGNIVTGKSDHTRHFLTTIGLWFKNPKRFVLIKSTDSLGQN
jgi:hypothetical protein